MTATMLPAAACTTTPRDSESIDEGGGGGSESYHARPPAAGPEKAPNGSGSVTFAISKLYLGDSDRDGTRNGVNDWRRFGFDLDGSISTAESKGLCQPRKYATPKMVYPDGDDGIDNSFGRKILPLLRGAGSDVSKRTNDNLADGAFTILIDLEKLGPDADYNPLHARLYGCGPLGDTAAFDGTDIWPISSDTLDDAGNAMSAKAESPMSYLATNTWVSHSIGPVVLTLDVSNFPFQLTIPNALITMQLDSMHRIAVSGTIAGVLSTEAIAKEARKVVGYFNPNYCEGPTVEDILSQVAQASDILQDGTQDPAKPCDGISIGIGFDAVVVHLGEIVPPAKMPPDPCGP